MKTNTNGFALLEAVLIIVVVVAVAGIGTYAYHRVKQNTAKAHASSWTTLTTVYSHPGTGPATLANFSAKACKTAIVSAQVGGDADVTYKVQFNLVNTNPTYRGTQVGVAPVGSGFTAKMYTGWYANAYQSFTVTASRQHKDVINISEYAPSAQTTVGTGLWQYNISNPNDLSNGINGTTNGGPINPALIANC